MCLAIPMKIKSIKGNTGVVEYAGVKYNAGLQFLKGLKIGDYVIVHAGFAIEKVDKKEARRTLKIYENIKKRF